MGRSTRKWIELGGLTGEYGRPLCDERDLPDGGRCTAFEGGHIHKNGDKIECESGSLKSHVTELRHLYQQLEG